MFIKEITLRNFRSHKDTRVAGLGRYSIFLGPNGAGKSSILDAVAYALTGVCRGTDDGGRGAELLSTHATDKRGAGTIILKTDKGELGRLVGEGPKSRAHLRILQAVGGNAAMLRAIIQPGHFMGLPEPEQKALFLAAMEQRLNPAEVRKLLGEELWAYLSDPERLGSLAAVEQLERQARDQRPALKNELAALGARAGGIPKPNWLSDREDPAGIMAAVQGQLQALRSERDAFLQAQATARARRVGLEVQLQVARTRLERLQAGLAAIGDPGQAQLAADKLRQDIAKDAAAAEVQEQVYNDLAHARARQQALLEATQGAIRKVTAIDGRCPACSRSLPPPERRALLAQLQDEAAGYECELKKVVKRQANAGFVELNKTNRLRDDLLALEKMLAAYDEAQTQLAPAEQDIKTLAAELAGAGAKEPDAAALAELDTRILASSAMLADLSGYVADQRAQAGVVKRRAAVAAELELTERLIEVLGPKGPVRGRLVGGGLGPFLDELNGILAGWGIPKVEAVTEPWRILVGGLPAALCSTSEGYRLSLAFAAVFAKRSGLGILCMDNAEVLDGENRALLPEILSRAGLDQAILAGTADAPEGRELPDWAFYLVEKSGGGSRVTALREPAAA